MVAAMKDPQSLNDKLDEAVKHIIKYHNDQLSVVGDNIRDGMYEDSEERRAGYDLADSITEAEAQAQLLTIIESLVDEVIKAGCPSNCNQGHLMQEDEDGVYSDYGMCHCVQYRDRATSLLKALKENHHE